MIAIVVTGLVAGVVAGICSALAFRAGERHQRARSRGERT